MPRVNIPVTTSTVYGATLPAATAGNATDNMVIANSGRERFIARNTGATPRLVTIRFSRTVRNQAITSITNTIAASAEVVFGPYPVDDFGTLLQVDVAHAEVTFRAIA